MEMKYLDAVLAFIKAHWVTELALGSVLFALDKPYIEKYVAAHPLASFIYANIAAVVTFYIHSPLMATISNTAPAVPAPVAPKS